MEFRTFENEITNVTVSGNSSNIKIKISLKNQPDVLLNYSDLVYYGYMDWFNISMKIRKLKGSTEVKVIQTEINTLMEVAYEQGGISEEIYRRYCMIMELTENGKPLCISNKRSSYRPSDFDLPAGLEFKENTYAGEPFRGFMYKDHEGAECFVSVDHLHSNPDHLIVGLKWLAKGKQNSFFRKKATRRLWYYKSTMKNKPELKDIKQEILDEFAEDTRLETEREAAATEN